MLYKKIILDSLNIDPNEIIDITETKIKSHLWPIYYYDIKFSKNQRKETILKIFNKEDDLLRNIEMSNFLGRLDIRTPHVYGSGEITKNKYYLLMEYIQGSKSLSLWKERIKDLGRVHNSITTNENDFLEFIDKGILVDRNYKRRLQEVEMALTIIQQSNILAETELSSLQDIFSENIRKSDDDMRTICFFDFFSENSKFSRIYEKIVYFDFKRASFALPFYDISCMFLEGADLQACLEYYLTTFRANKFRDKLINNSERLLNITTLERIVGIIDSILDGDILLHDEEKECMLTTYKQHLKDNLRRFF